MGPGLRLGYMIPPHETQDLKTARISSSASGLASMIVAEYLKDNLENHIKRHCDIIRAKRDHLLSILEDHFSGICTWNPPRGGLFCWLKLPETVDLRKLDEETANAGVEYTPGRDFHVNNEEVGFIRLSYAHMSNDEIAEGISRIAGCIKNSYRG